MEAPGSHPGPFMKPFINLAQSRTPDGAELTLHEHDSQYFMRVNRQPLMGTNASESEKELAQLACSRLHGQPGKRMLIGGLGFGFTLRRVLELAGKDAVIDVAELLPEVVAWNREFLGHLNGKLLDDPRVNIMVTDVCKVIAECPASHYDAIMLDVDNGPVAMVRDGNARLYQQRGFELLSRALRPKGRVAFWSASQDKPFVERFGKAGFHVDAVAVKAYPQARRPSHTIFVGTPRG